MIWLALALAACGGKRAPEADPAAIETLAQTMLRNVPVPAGARDCTYEEVVGGATLTRRTVLELAKQPIEDRAEVAPWINPPDLDSPAARTLVESKHEAERRRAAAELLAAPFFLVYHVDLVDSPIAIGVKDFKRATVGARAIRYDKAGAAACVLVFTWGHDPKQHAWAIRKSDRPAIDPAVQKAMQDDLGKQMLVRIANLAAPPPKFDGPADTRHDRQDPTNEIEQR